MKAVGKKGAKRALDDSHQMSTPKKKRRPEEGRPAAIGSGLQQFKSLTPTKHFQLYLGSEWKNLSRNWKNYLTDINQRVADLTETEHDEDADDEARELAIM